MKKAGRPSNAPKKLKDGFYMSISIPNTSKSLRIMREDREQMELVKIKYQHRNFKYLGEVKNNVWIDGENKGKSTT
jgi:ribosomal protein S4E